MLVFRNLLVLAAAMLLLFWVGACTAALGSWYVSMFIRAGFHTTEAAFWLLELTALAQTLGFAWICLIRYSTGHWPWDDE